MREFFKSLRSDAAYESGKITFAILGVGSTLANIGTMRLWLMFPATALVTITWYSIYRMCQ